MLGSYLYDNKRECYSAKLVDSDGAQKNELRKLSRNGRRGELDVEMGRLFEDIRSETR